MLRRLTQKLYLRVWLAVVLMLLLLGALTAIAWRMYQEHERLGVQDAPTPIGPRVLIVKNASGAEIARATPTHPRRPGEGLEFDLTLSDGQYLQIQMLPRQRTGEFRADFPGFRPGVSPQRRSESEWMPEWMRPPYGFLWLFGLVSLAVALGAYPVARRLTQRIEALHKGVRQFGEGDLRTRVQVQGQDEVAYLAEQFNASAQRIENLVHAQKSLLANASHELRSPLTRIRMGLEMLQSASQPTPMMASLTDEMRRSIVELDILIEEILLASKLDATVGQQPSLGELENVDMLAIAVEECARAGVSLEFESRPTYIVRGYARLLQRVIRNLLENAKRYSRGEIGMQMKSLAPVSKEKRATAQRILEVLVMDHGPGVPFAQRERIFEPFYRLPGASESNGGVGLGLALVRSIMTRHEGSVTCVDRPDGLAGACFQLRIQLVTQ